MPTTKDAVADLPALDLQNLVEIKRASDMSVTVTLTSCRAASQFYDEIKAGWGITIATQPAPSGDAVEVLREALIAVDEQLVAILNSEDGSHHRKLKAARDALVRIWLPMCATSQAATVAKDGGNIDTSSITSAIILDTDKMKLIFKSKAACEKFRTQLHASIFDGATSKPEASAANQQAGEWKVSQCGMYAQAIPGTVAAPISEGTGKPTAADVGDLSLENAPIGTKAPAIMGGHWIRVERGWKWCTGSTFPRPGGDWTGELIAPAAPAACNGDALPPFHHFGLSAEALEQLLQAGLKPEEIGGADDVQHDRVGELVRWFARFTQGHANPKWLTRHACELAYFIATNGINRGIDLEAVRNAAFKEGVNISPAERGMLERIGFAARAGTGSARTIDCDEFWILFGKCRDAKPGKDYENKRNAFVAYIDTRATKVEAAPGNAGEGVA